MTDPIIDVVIPLHRTGRAIDAAVASAQSSVQGIATRVLLVLHNLSIDDATRTTLTAHATLLCCDDGITSPSGPRNAGLDAATAPFVFFLDSDDVLAPDCLRQLHEVACQTGADVILPSIRGSAGYLGTPLVVSRRRQVLDPVRHALFLRSHSFALLRREALLASGIRYPARIPSGEDLVFMSRLYTSATTAIAFDAVYHVLDHPGERITTTRLSAADQLAAVDHLLHADWMKELSGPERRALVHRILSVNLAGGWRRMRTQGHAPSPLAYATMRDLATKHDPGARRLLSVRDRFSLRFRQSPAPVERGMVRYFTVLMPTSLAGLLNPRGPLGIESRKWVVRHRRRRLAMTAASPRREEVS